MKYTNFKDIPKFTSWGSYNANVNFKYLLSQLKAYEKDGLQYCPDFQRGHVWNKEQQIKFIEYMLRGGKSARIIYFNHPGWMGNWKGDFVVVDGLQRLTAAKKFLNNEISVFGTYCKDFEDKLSNDVDFIFNINNLKTRKEVLQWYIEFNSGGTVHTKEEIDKVKKLLEQEVK
jgi:uncharacterized protein with ParB-like and HNH nuclease domain